MSKKKYNNTIEYYKNNCEEFYKSTVNVTFSTMQERFLQELKAEAYILDFGCGSGRDTKYFLEKGYKVDAIDGCKELCDLASSYTNVKVKNMYFEELSEVEKYDGIWACSSILHLPINELIDVLRRMAMALKSEGIIYTSFKYGEFAGERHGRYFTDMTEKSFQDLLTNVDGLYIKEEWVTTDVRPERGGEQWLNLILKKMRA